MTSMSDETATFNVVVNHEEQYSIWASSKAIPAGWHSVGHEGTKADCLRYIEQVWTDMRPLSLNNQQRPGQTGTDR
jgi:MbtH protein